MLSGGRRTALLAWLRARDAIEDDYDAEYPSYLDRHLRRMRARYRGRRDALVKALTVTLPEAAVGGMAAGLHVTLQLPDSDNDQAIREEAHHRGVELETMNDYRPAARSRPPTLLLGYGQMPEHAIRAGVRELAMAVRAARTRAIVISSA